LYTWGKGSYGRLGHGFTNDLFEPMMVEEIEQIKIIDAALGSYYTFVVSSDRTVYQWGGTDFPLPIPIPELRSKNITEISAGPYHFLALDMKGNIYSWGNGRQGKLGFKNSASLKVPMKIPEPIKFGKAVSKTYHMF